MPNILDRNRMRLPKGMLFLCALAMAQALCLADASDVGSKAFDGHWTYSNECNLGHYAELKLVQKGNSVTGDWSDGSRVEGWDGSLKRSIRDGKLHTKYCTTEPNGGHAV